MCDRAFLWTDCQVRCGEVVLRTAAKTQTTTPEWHQEFKFGVRKPLGDIVKFKVFAFSDVKDELLGEASLTIADLPADETVRTKRMKSIRGYE